MNRYKLIDASSLITTNKSEHSVVEHLKMAGDIDHRKLRRSEVNVKAQ